jgi:hypothetical protein
MTPNPGAAHRDEHLAITDAANRDLVARASPADRITPTGSVTFFFEETRGMPLP